MFGCILAGQSVQTNFEAVSETDLLLRLDNLQSSFLTIFMTGEKPFPDGLAGAIYISIPAGQGETECWSYLGHVSNQKPSGTFKIDNLKRMAQQNINSFGSNNYAGPQIGISVKTINEIENFTPGKLYPRWLYSTLRVGLQNLTLRILPLNSKIQRFRWMPRAWLKIWPKICSISVHRLLVGILPVCQYQLSKCGFVILNRN